MEQGCVSVSNCQNCAQGQVCCNGKCQECCTPEDCTPTIGTDFQAVPPIGNCTLSQCVDGTCYNATQTCGFEEVCCTRTDVRRSVACSDGSASQPVARRDRLELLREAADVRGGALEVAGAGGVLPPGAGEIVDGL